MKTYKGTIKLTPKYSRCLPILITGDWHFIEEKNRWVSENAVPAYYRNVQLNADCCEIIETA